MIGVGSDLGNGGISVGQAGEIAATPFQIMHPNTIPGKIAMLATDALKGVAMFFYVIAVILTVFLLFIIDYAINNRFVSMVNRVVVADLTGVASEFVEGFRSLAHNVSRDFRDPTTDSDSDDASSVSSVSGEDGDDDDFDTPHTRGAGHDQQFGAMDERSLADFKNRAALEIAALRARAHQAHADFQAHGARLWDAFDADGVRRSADFQAHGARLWDAFDADGVRRSAGFIARDARAPNTHFGTMGDNRRFSSQ